jgi:hypothetical protein
MFSPDPLQIAIPKYSFHGDSLGRISNLINYRFVTT